MLKTEKKVIDGLTFYINQFPARKSIKLEKRTITYLAPMLTMLDEMDKGLDSDVDLSKIAKGIQSVLTGIDDDALELYINDMIEYVAVESKNDKGQAVSNNPLIDVFDVVFIGKTLTAFKLLLEIMKINNFAFFELMGGGGINLTGIFQQVMPKIKES